MSNDVKKRHPEDMTRLELIARLGWPARTFTDRFKKFLDFYGIDKHNFTYSVFDMDIKKSEDDKVPNKPKSQKARDNDELRKILIDYRYKELLYVLLAAFEEHPLYRENVKEDAISLDRVIKYNETLIGLIEGLPKSEKYSIQSKPIYYRTVAQLPAMKKMSDKIHQFLAASMLVPKQVRLQVWEEMFDFVDYMIFRTFDLAVEYNNSEMKKAKRQRVKAEKLGKVLEENPNRAFCEMLNQHLDSRTTEEATDKDLPCDTLDGYLALSLKTHIHIVSLLESNPKKKAELELMFKTAVQLSGVYHEAVARKLGVGAAAVAEAENGVWEEEVQEYAEQAKRPFSGATCLSESMREIWERYKDEAECKFDRNHYQAFIAFCVQVEETSADRSYLLNNIVKEPVMDLLKTK